MIFSIFQAESRLNPVKRPEVFLGLFLAFDLNGKNAGFPCCAGCVARASQTSDAGIQNGDARRIWRQIFDRSAFPTPVLPSAVRVADPQKSMAIHH